MERIVVNPLEVRGLGDVVSAKTLDDYVKCGMSLSQGSDSSLGTVFTGSYLAPAKLTLTVDRYISSSTESFTVGATLKNSSNTAISGATLYLDVNGTVTSATTDNSGVASFTVNTDGSHEYRLKCYYRGSVSVGGVFVNTSVVVVGTPTSLDLNVVNSVIQSGDVDGVWATLLDDEGEPIPYASVSFYEEWTPAIRLSANPSVIQSGGDTDLSAQLVDADDGSLVREAGHTVTFYTEKETGYLINDPAEYTHTASGLKTLFTLKELPDTWELACDFKTSTESRFVMGVAEDFTGSNPNNSIFVGSPNGTNKMYYGYRDVTTHPTDLSGQTPSNYNNFKMAYNNGTVVFTVNGTSYTVNNISIFSGVTDFVIGLVSWSSSETVYVKNIKLSLGGS